MVSICSGTEDTGRNASVFIRKGREISNIDPVPMKNQNIGKTERFFPVDIFTKMLYALRTKKHTFEHVEQNSNYIKE